MTTPVSNTASQPFKIMPATQNKKEFLKSHEVLWKNSNWKKIVHSRNTGQGHAQLGSTGLQVYFYRIKMQFLPLCLIYRFPLWDFKKNFSIWISGIIFVGWEAEFNVDSEKRDVQRMFKNFSAL